MPDKGAREHVDHPADLNNAFEEELTKDGDIGSQRARKIVDHRSQHGALGSVDELKNVEGFSGTLKDDLRRARTVSGSREVA